MSSPVLGVIGGLGPLATAAFLEEMARMTDAPKEQAHPDLILYNFPSIPDRTGYILGSNLKSPLPGLLWAARALEREGVGAIAIPCVTAHYFYPELCRELSIPVLHAIRLTARELHSQGVQCAGVLASEGTLRAGLFHRELEKLGIRTRIPEPEAQAAVTCLCRSIKRGLPPDPALLRQAEASLKAQGAQVLILGAGELTLLRRELPLGPGYLDTTQVLARAAVEACGKGWKPEYRCLITP